jgi:hypothetical protein
MSARVFRCCIVRIVSNEMTSLFTEFCHLSDLGQACISISPKKWGHSDHIHGTFPHLVPKRMTKSYRKLPVMSSNHFYATLFLRINLGANTSHSRDVRLFPLTKFCGDFKTEIMVLRWAAGKTGFESRQKQDIYHFTKSPNRL